MTDRPPAERAVDLEHGEECHSDCTSGRICDCGAETIRDLRAEVERLTASADRFARALDQDRRDLVKDWNAEVYNARKDRDQERRMADATAVHLTQALEKVAALEGVCRNHEGTISVMNDGLRATMAREDLLAAQVATLTAERDVARAEAATVDAQRRGTGAAIPEIAARERANEREGCAQLANWHLNNIERLRPSANDGWLKGYRDACADLETAIRAREAK